MLRMRAISLMAIGVVVCGGVAAQSVDDALRIGQRQPAIGARLMALGGAGVSGVGDYGALYRNPAGLGYLKESLFFLSMRIEDVEDLSNSQTTGFSATRHTGQTTPVRVGGLGVVYRVPTRRGALVLAGGFNQVQTFDRYLQFGGTNVESTLATSFLPFDSEYQFSGSNLVLADIPYIGYVAGLFAPDSELSRDEPESYPFLEAVIPGTELEQFGEVSESGRLNEISLGGAVEIAQDIMLGVSANLIAGSYAFNSFFLEEDLLNQNPPEAYSLTLEDGSVVEGFHSLEYRQHLDSDVLGAAARVGISGGAARRFRWGANFETPTIISVQESYSTRLETQFDSGDVLAYTSEDGDEGDGIFNYDLRTPARLSVGASYDAGWAKVLLDVEWVDWTTMRFFANSTDDYFGGLNNSIRRELKSVTNSRVGIEVSLGKWVARGGMSKRQHPFRGQIPGSTGVPLEVDRTYYSLGVAYEVTSTMILEASMIRTGYDSVYRPYPEDEQGARQDITLYIDEDIRDRVFVFSAQYLF